MGLHCTSCTCMYIDPVTDHCGMYSGTPLHKNLSEDTPDNLIRIFLATVHCREIPLYLYEHVHSVYPATADKCWRMSVISIVRTLPSSKAVSMESMTSFLRLWRRS